MKTRNALLTVVLLAFLPGTVRAQGLTLLELNPSTVPGGVSTEGKVTLSSPAPAGGTTVNLASSLPGAALTPTLVLVPAGTTSKTFTITTEPATGIVAVTISATLAGGTRTAILTVQPTPPVSLVAGAFTLVGATYQSIAWNPAQNTWTATGQATALLTADGISHPLAVQFANLTIQPIVQGTGNVTAGTATYTPPGAPPAPEVLPLAGFKLLLDGLVIQPANAAATGRLEFPASLVDVEGGEGRPGKVDLGTFPLTPDCRFYVSKPAGAFGPWVLGPHGIKFSGIHFEADFSPTQSPILNPPVLPAFRGVVLRSAVTTPAAGTVISNTGYLQGAYSFADAQVTATGLKARFDLAADLEFNSLDPWGYTLVLRHGHLDLADSTVTGGAFVPKPDGSSLSFGFIQLPEKSLVYRGTKGRLAVTYNNLEVQSDLDLYGQVFLGGGNEVTWGELNEAGNPRFFYDAGKFNAGHFYLSATSKPAFWPLDAAGKFKDLVISTPLTQLEALGMQGVTFRWADDNGSTIDPTFTIRTPDVPVGENLEWSVIAARCWINVGARGVHADIFSERGSTKPDDPLEMLVGPNYSPSYVPPSGDGEPFSVTLETVEFDRRYTWLFQFVESAVHRSDMNGKVHLGFPTSDDLPFEHMQFTSTAHNTGAEVKLFEPIQLGYWDLDLVPKQLSSTVGAMSVRTGQIFITAAGIHEPRHFARPFNLLWGELLASGEAGGFLFDHDTSGQEFDGFVFVPEVVALSEVATEPGAAPPYLHVAGTAQFDFFGANYLDIRDHRDDANPGAPHNGRTIVLAEGGEHDAKPTDFHVARAWDGDFGALDFTIQYDDQDQDGFVSDPQAVDSNRFEVAYFDNVPVAAALDLKSERACISIREEEERTVSFPLLIDLGKVKRITGCGCIEDGVLKRFILASELSANGSGLALRSGAYVAVEKIFTPATSEFSLNGDLFLNVLGGGDVQVNGQVHFLLDREKDFFEGDIKGKIDASSYLGFIELGGLSAEGQLSWHVGSFDNDGYQLLQGKVAVNVVAPAGAAGAGVEGGFLLGMNAPREKAWVIIGTDHRFDGNIQLLPPVLTGVFGYAKVSSSVNAYVVSGGFDAYLGAGGFLGANGLPGVFGHMYANIWGEFLGGLLSASAWLDAQIYLEVPNLAEPLKSIPKFQGSVGVQVCAVWVLCATEEVTMTIDGDGFEFTN